MTVVAFLAFHWDLHPIKWVALAAAGFHWVLVFVAELAFGEETR